MVATMAQEDVRWYPILDSTPSWAATLPDSVGSGIAPADVTDFLDYVTAFARRYGTGGTFWLSHPSLPQLPVHDYEIWNEENSSDFWLPQSDAPERYADLYAETRSALQEVDPTARVIVGGLGRAEPPRQSDPIWFLQQMLARRPDLRGQIDAVGFHPYEPTLAEVYNQIREFRQGLDRVAGPAVPIDINEIGWPTTEVSEAQRAADLQALALELPGSGCNIAHLLPYTWLTAEHDGTDSEQWFGIWNLDGSPKPSGQAHLDAVMTMRGWSTLPTPPASPIRPGPAATPPPPQPRLRLTQGPSTWFPAGPGITTLTRTAPGVPLGSTSSSVSPACGTPLRPSRSRSRSGRGAATP